VKVRYSARASQLEPVTQQTSTDIDECDEEPCDDICINTPGSYSCSCGSGYSLLLDGKTCADIDECKENPRICNGGKCTNTIGSYICHCTEGLLPGPGGTSCLGKTQRRATVDLNRRFRHRRVQAKSKHLRQRRMRQHSGVVPVQVRRRLLSQARRGPFLQRRRRVLLGLVQLPHQRRLHK
jgi:hypothetical protein